MNQNIKGLKGVQYTKKRIREWFLNTKGCIKALRVVCWCISLCSRLLVEFGMALRQRAHNRRGRVGRKPKHRETRYVYKYWVSLHGERAINAVEREELEA